MNLTILDMNLTVLIIAATAAISVWAFQRHDIYAKLLLSPYMVVHRKQWYRLITHGFVHANWPHLLINMLVLYSFGTFIENLLGVISSIGAFHFIMLYFGGMVAASITDIARHKDNYAYGSVGASGAVSAVLFSYIFFAPWEKILFMAVIPVPSIVFGVLYLMYSSYMSKKGVDNINHDAHFYGALFGFVYPLVIDPHLLHVFIQQLINPYF